MFKKTETQNLSVDEKIKAIEEQISGLEKKRTDAEATGLSSFRHLRKEDEVQSIIALISAKRGEIEKLRLDNMKATRDEVIQKAQALADEKRSLLKRIRKIDAEGLRLREVFEKNIPHRRRQISSSQFVKMEREVCDTVRNVNLTDEGDPTYEKIPRKVEEYVPAIPDKVRRFQAEGWKLCPGEKFEPEPLDGDNSINVPTVGVPDVFVEFNPIVGPMG
jgi:hypothetical protein